MEVTWLKVDRWNRYKGLVHGFLGRRGGRSVGPYAALNLSFRVGDDPHVVKDNICDMKKAVGIHDRRVITMKQVHGDHIAGIKDKNLKEAGEADGMITDEPEAFLGVLTADCVPILLVAPERRCVAVVHAGWRGTLAGIAAKMVRRFKQDYGVSPNEIEAALGPAIGDCCYEIGDDVARPLIDAWGNCASVAMQEKNGKKLLDLRLLNQAVLEQAGIPSEQVLRIGPCTSCVRDEFFSYRREKKETGRQISFIGWSPESS